MILLLAQSKATIHFFHNPLKIQGDLRLSSTFTVQEWTQQSLSKYVLNFTVSWNKVTLMSKIYVLNHLLLQCFLLLILYSFTKTEFCVQETQCHLKTINPYYYILKRKKL